MSVVMVDATPIMFGDVQRLLRRARSGKGWTGQRLIDEAIAWLRAKTNKPWSLSRAAYSDWENGKQQIPYPWMVAFSHVLETSFPDLGWPMGFGAGTERGASGPTTCGLCGGQNGHPDLIVEVIASAAWSMDPAEVEGHRYPRILDTVTTGALNAEGDAETRSWTDQEDTTKRRDALKTFGALPMLLAETAAESKILSRREETTDLGPASLEHVSLAIEQFGLSYLHVPPHELFLQVRACRRHVMELLDGRQTLSQRRELYVLLGWLCGLLGHLSLDRDIVEICG